MDKETDDPKQLFKALMSDFPTGVTIVGAARPGEQPFGMTANAVCAVSLEPLMLLVCVRSQAHILSVINATGSFSINILHQDQSDISRCFAGSPDFANPTWQFSDGIPVLASCIGSFTCTVSEIHIAGDHHVVFGNVQQVFRRSGQTDPLVYRQGQYHRFTALEPN